MHPDVIALRTQARHYRDLARLTTDAQANAVLIQMADEWEQEADEIEAGDLNPVHGEVSPSGEQPFRQPDTG